MNIIKKILFSLSIFLVYAVGRKILHELNAPILFKVFFSLICITIIIEIWENFILFSAIFSRKNGADSKFNNKSELGDVGDYTVSSNNTNTVINKDDDGYFSMIERMKNSDLNEHIDDFQEDALYLQATLEVDEGRQDKGLWAKCMTLCEGDENKAKYKYVKQRVMRLEKEFVRQSKLQDQISLKKDKCEEQGKDIYRIIDSYLDGKDTKSLRKLLRNNNYDYDQMYDGRYILRKGKEIIEFNTQREFYNYLKGILPKLDGFFGCVEQDMKKDIKFVI